MTSRRFPHHHVPEATRLWQSLGTEEMPWIHTPRFGWECRITHETLSGAYATQATEITIAETDFVTGRLVVTFTGGPLVAPVPITVDAAVGTDEIDLGEALLAAITAAFADGEDLEGVVASIAHGVTGNNVVIPRYVPGIGLVNVTAVFTPAQQVTATWGGTLVDGEYGVRFVNVAEALDVTVSNNRAAATPANVNAMAAAFETAAGALIATTLADVLVSADDAGAVNTLIFEPGHPTVIVTALVTCNTTHTFGGTATDGNYVSRFVHDDLPGGGVTVTTNRSAAATSTDLADAYEADVEARALLFPYLLNANNTAGANVITFHAGVTGMDVVSVSAPAPGTLVVADPTLVIADATPTGPVVTVTHSVTLDLSSIAFDQAVVGNVIRSWCFLAVIDEFGADRTITVGDANEPAGVLGSTPVSLNTIARACSATADAEYQPRPELAWVPTATIALGTSLTLTQGEALIEILFTPNLANVAAA